MNGLSQGGKIKGWFSILLAIVFLAGLMKLSLAQVAVTNSAGGFTASDKARLDYQTPVFVGVWSPVPTMSPTPTGTLTPSNTPTKTFTPNLTTTITFTPSFTNTPVWTNTPNNVIVLLTNTPTCNVCTGTPTPSLPPDINEARIGGTPVVPANTPPNGFAPGVVPVVSVPTATTPGIATNNISDVNGRMINMPFAPWASWKTASGSISTATTVQMVAKSGALNNIIMGISISDTSSTLANETTALYVTSNSVTVWSCNFQTVTAGTTGWVSSCYDNYPIACGNNSVSLTASAAVTTLQWQISYIQDN